MIKAIQTEYNGDLFRSRLEARWAVFYTTLGIEYKYEVEGYHFENEDTHKTLYYLPDFYLPKYKCFVEIKGNKPNDEECDKAYWLSHHSGKTVFIFYGDIQSQLDIFTESAYIDGGADFHYMWCECPYCKELGIEFDGRSARVNHKENCKALEDLRKGYDKLYNYKSPRLLDAYKKAHQARFEHGERP